MSHNPKDPSAADPADAKDPSAADPADAKEPSAADLAGPKDPSAADPAGPRDPRTPEQRSRDESTTVERVERRLDEIAALDDDALDVLAPLTEEELALEALANGRDDLADAVLAAMLAEDEGGRAKIAQARALSIDVGIALQSAVPKVDVQAMVTHALAACPPAPSRRSLVWGSALGVLATLVLLPLAIELPSAGQVLDGGQLVVALFGALDRLVEAIPGGWSLIGLGLAIGLALVLVPARVITRRLSPIAALLIVASASAVHAQRFEGAWPEESTTVSVEVVDAPRSEAIRRIAEAAGLGVVVRLDDDPNVTVRAHGVSVRDALRGVLDDAHEVRREGSTLFVRRSAPAPTSALPAVAPTEAVPAAATTPPVPPTQTVPTSPVLPTIAASATTPSATTPSTPAANPSRAEAPVLPERRAFGGDVEVRADERVRSVSAFGGDVDVAGEVVENVVAFGGDVEVREGALVRGDLMATGGDVVVRRGGEVQGRIMTTGGELRVEDGARMEQRPIDAADFDRHEGIRSALSSAVKHSLLFLLGLLFLGVFRERHANLARVIVERPGRTAVVGFFGMVGAVVLTIVLLITLIGIPGALVVGLGTFLAVYGGIAVTASVLGAVLPFEALAGRPVAQLFVGILVLYLLSLVPVLGGVVGVIVASLGLGAMLTTRFGAREPRSARARDD
ncbi:MAG: polymer-forming cytoskeletal protein [Myxococcota bacterium]|jgi:hypothetical protein|nr:polymer-forming cytoskeletal protein [Myxococcota bacterium]